MSELSLDYIINIGESEITYYDKERCALDVYIYMCK